MKPEPGILPASRARLATVLRAARETVSIDTAMQALDVDRRKATRLLSQWSGQGWLTRVGPGIYVPVPLDLAGNEQVLADPWVLVPTLFGQCYIGGWTAAHHWDLTEQLFNKTVVFTTQRVVKKRVTAQGAAFILHNISPKRMFGLKTIWRGSAKIAVSDPARTLVDLLAMPDTGGGIDHVADCLTSYLNSKDADRNLLIRHADQFKNGAVFKRLGFLADTRLHDSALAEACRQRLTQGYAALDPGLPASSLATAWRVWIPDHWKDKHA
jgi:predicted transcriptional regulator of viral defense system